MFILLAILFFVPTFLFTLCSVNAIQRDEAKKRVEKLLAYRTGNLMS